MIHAERIIRKASLPLALGFVLAAAGCGKSEQSTETQRAATTETQLPGEQTTAPPPSRHLERFTFDLLGGTDTIVVVTSDPSRSADPETIPSATYRKGDTATADCRVKDGRMIESDPSIGEAIKKSDDWVGLTERYNSEGQTMYASTVYTDLTKAEITALPACAE